MTSARGRSSSKQLHWSRHSAAFADAPKHSTNKHLVQSAKPAPKEVDSEPYTARYRCLDTARHKSQKTEQSAQLLLQSSSRHRSAAHSHHRKLSSSRKHRQQQPPPNSGSDRHKARNIYYYNAAVSKVRSHSKSREVHPAEVGAAAESFTRPKTQQLHQRTACGLDTSANKAISTDQGGKQQNSATVKSMSEKYGVGGAADVRHQQSHGTATSTTNGGPNAANVNGNKSGRAQAPPSDEDKHRALAYKATGNECYKKSFYEAAVENYSLAIKYDPTEPTYRTNRALAYMKQEKWADLTADSESAIMLNPVFFKAHYLLGIGLQMTGRVDEAIEKLKQARRLAPEKKHSLDCDRAIRGAQKRKWELYAEQRRKDLDKLQQILSASGESLDEKSRAQLSELVQDAMTQLQPKTVPDYLCCHISMCVLTDPVTTPSGLTYERDLLLKHIQRNGPFDPLTRETCNASDVRSCVCIQRAIEDFLDENPGSAEDTCR